MAELPHRTATITVALDESEFPETIHEVARIALTCDDGPLEPDRTADAAFGAIPAEHHVHFIAPRVLGTGHRTGWAGYVVERRSNGNVIVLWDEHELEHPAPDLPAPPWWRPTEEVAPDELEVANDG